MTLRNAVCDGWIPGNPKPGTVSTTGTTETPPAGTTNQDIRQSPYYTMAEKLVAELNPNLVPFMKQVIQDKTNGKINFGLK